MFPEYKISKCLSNATVYRNHVMTVCTNTAICFVVFLKKMLIHFVTGIVFAKSYSKQYLRKSGMSSFICHVEIRSLTVEL